MQGRTALITGATNGIGRVAALAIAKVGYRILLTARAAGRGEAMAAELRQAGASDAIVLHGDLARQEDIRRIAAEARRLAPQLDLLVNNAGAFFMRRAVSSDGIEMTFATNHLSYVLLTLELLDTLKAAGRARIVNTASYAHTRATLDFDDLEFRRGYGGWPAYCRSKLGNVMFTYALARRLEGTGVTANCHHPGFVDTAIGNNNAWPVAALFGVFKRWRGITPEEGARGMIALALDPAFDGRTALYVDKGTVAPSSPLSRDAALQERLWEVSLRMTGLA